MSKRNTWRRNKVAMYRLYACVTAGCAWFGLSHVFAGDIHGTAFEKGGSKTVPGVAVELYRDSKKIAETNTDAHGQYKVEFDSAGSYRIEFAMLPDHCEAPYVDEPSLEANAVKVENVFVYGQNEELNSEDLVDMIRKRVSASGDPTRAFDDLVALSTTGFDPKILVQAGTKLGQGQPYDVTPHTGIIVKIENNALNIDTATSSDSREYKTFFGTIYIDESGKRIPFEKAKDLLVGKQGTAIIAKQGPDWVVKSVIGK